MGSSTSCLPVRRLRRESHSRQLAVNQGLHAALAPLAELIAVAVAPPIALGKGRK